jgi:hypothetical protein
MIYRDKMTDSEGPLSSVYAQSYGAPKMSMIPRPIPRPQQQQQPIITYEPLQAAQIKPIIRERRVSNPPSFPLHNYLKDKPTASVAVTILPPPPPVSNPKPTNQPKKVDPTPFPLHAYLKPQPAPDTYQPRPAIQPQTVSQLDPLHPAILPKKVQPLTTNKINPNNIPKSRCKIIFLKHC